MSPSPHGDGGHGGAMPSSSDPGLAMVMVFQNIQATPLFSNAWTPRSAGAYAGTCIFLLLLAVLFRALIAVKIQLDRRWAAAAYSRRYVVVAGQTPEAERIQNDPNASTANLVTSNGVEEKVKVIRRPLNRTPPFRFSVDLPRAALVMVIAGVGYLLMLAVMTMNIGYFMSILAGVFVGDLAVGRFGSSETH
ncbi:low affinity copper transporter [Histoplasma ohiense]|uniref:Copper transport protein n=1 Tax=Ajellomyces capsulatus TaxID=5037 RepID=Q1HRW6_AJECA|nr:low affinity copper transporter [Histoplasma capsulatum]KAG5298515.1 low affinity copper transporter [Histoplasma ohiense (nom. inval.)]